MDLSQNVLNTTWNHVSNYCVSFRGAAEEEMKTRYKLGQATYSQILPLLCFTSSPMKCSWKINGSGAKHDTGFLLALLK